MRHASYIQVLHPYIIYIYISSYNQSEGVPRTGYFIPAHVGAGAGQVWGVLPPALFQGRKSQEISSLDGARHGVLGFLLALWNFVQEETVASGDPLLINLKKNKSDYKVAFS